MLGVIGPDSFNSTQNCKESVIFLIHGAISVDSKTQLDHRNNESGRLLQNKQLELPLPNSSQRTDPGVGREWRPGPEVTLGQQLGQRARRAHSASVTIACLPITPPDCGASQGGGLLTWSPSEGASPGLTT